MPEGWARNGFGLSPTSWPPEKPPSGMTPQCTSKEVGPVLSGPDATEHDQRARRDASHRHRLACWQGRSVPERLVSPIGREEFFHADNAGGTGEKVHSQRIRDGSPLRWSTLWRQYGRGSFCRCTLRGAGKCGFELLCQLQEIIRHIFKRVAIEQLPQFPAE